MEDGGDTKFPKAENARYNEPLWQTRSRRQDERYTKTIRKSQDERHIKTILEAKTRSWHTKTITKSQDAGHIKTIPKAKTRLGHAKFIPKPRRDHPKRQYARHTKTIPKVKTQSRHTKTILKAKTRGTQKPFQKPRREAHQEMEGHSSPTIPKPTVTIKQPGSEWMRWGKEIWGTESRWIQSGTIEGRLKDVVRDGLVSVKENSEHPGTHETRGRESGGLNVLSLNQKWCEWVWKWWTPSFINEEWDERVWKWWTPSFIIEVRVKWEGVKVVDAQLYA